jgi:transposase
MKKSPRVYTEEFKKQAIQLAQDLGSRTTAARQLGISDVNILNWENKQRGTSTVVQAESVDVSEELKRLRKETAEQKKVIQILKSAAAFFSQDHLK